MLKVVVPPINKDFYAPIFSHKWDKNIFFERGKLAFSVRPKSSRFADFLRQRRFRGFLRGRGPRCVWSWTCPPWRWARSCRGCRSRGPAASVATRYASSPARVNKKIQKNPFLSPCIKENMISYWTFMAVCWLVSLAVCKGKKVALPLWYHSTCFFKVQYLSIAIDYLTGKFCLVDVVPAVWLVILRQPPTLPLAQLNNKQGC